MMQAKLSAAALYRPLSILRKIHSSRTQHQQMQTACLSTSACTFASMTIYTASVCHFTYHSFSVACASQVGFGLAVEYALELGIDWIWDRTQELASSLRSKLQNIPGATVHDTGRTLSGIVTFTMVRHASHTPASEQLWVQGEWLLPQLHLTALLLI